ncbi:hypothetical protein [Campylobacter jejuni]|uniref:hypothetical protein n=1 Tax=Campylobacter jejuni TaxID=197 RepID=UPI00207BE722|nr:hypothetical protein [Campylobacter jejuni]
MIEFLNEDRKKFKEYLIDFFHNAYNSDKLSSKDEIVNFDFLKNYGFCVKLSYGKGTISKIPWIIFIRTDTQEYKASYGIYVYCGIMEKVKTRQLITWQKIKLMIIIRNLIKKLMIIKI